MIGQSTRASKPMTLRISLRISLLTLSSCTSVTWCEDDGVLS